MSSLPLRLPFSHFASLPRALTFLVALFALALGAQAQSTWTGATDSDWNTAGNWSTNAVPTAGDDVVIPSVATFPVVSLAAAAVCRDLHLVASAEMTLAPLAVLDVSGDVVIDGTTQGVGVLHLVGGAAVAVSGSSALPALDVDKDPAAPVAIQGVVTLAGNFVLREGVLSANSSVAFQLPASFLGGTLLSTGSYRFESSVSFNGTSVNAQPAMTVLGAWESNASFQPTSGTVVFDGDSALSGSPSFFNVTIDIGAPQVSVVHVNVPTDIRGSLSIRGNARINGNQIVTVDQDLDIDNGGTFDTAGNDHEFGRSLTIDGSIVGGGSFACVGSSAGTIAASQPLPALTVAKNGVSNLTLGGSATIAITGDLRLSSGILTVSRTTRVAGVSTFEGGSLAGSSTLDLDDDANFVGASVTLPPTITCSGDWTADSFYDPAGGTVTLDGTPGSSQTIDLSGASFGTQTNFYVLNIAAGATVTAASELRIRSSMTVSGQFTADAPMDQDGAFAVATSAVFDARGFTHTFAGNVSLNTAIQVDGTGVFLFDGSASASLATPTTVDVTVPNVRVQKTAGASLWIGYRLTVNGTFELLSGRLTGAWSTIVTGDALFQGGHLGSTTTAYGLEVRGDVVCDGAVAVTPPNITFDGNWTSDNLFAPQAGAVVCGGNSPQVLTSSSGPLRFSQLTVDVGSTASTQEVVACTGLVVDGAFNTTAPMDCDGSVTVGAQGALDAGAATHAIAGNLSVSGNLLATGLLVFDGDTASSVASVDPLPNVRLAKSENQLVTMSTLTIDGDIELDGGHLRTTSQTLTVTGDAHFDGGVLSYANVIVDGNVTFAGTQSVGNVGSGTSHVNLICHGDFVGHAAFRPVAGTITIDDPAATLSGVLELSSLAVATNATVQILNPLKLSGVLSLNGQMDLQASNQTMEVHSHTTFGNGAQLRLGNQVYRFGRNFTTALGSVVRSPNTVLEFFGPNAASISHNTNAPLPPVIIRKDAQAAVSTSGAIEVDGNLLLESGTFSVVSPTEVTGDATFQFGSLTGNSAGLLTVNGDVVFAGALGLSPPNMVVKGDWTADSLFRPTVRTVTFDGSGSIQNLLGSEGRFFALVLDVGATVVSNAPMRCDHSLTIQSATLESNNPADFVVAGLVNTSGTLDIEQALRVGGNLDASGSLVVGGELQVAGDVSIPSGTVSIAGGRLGGSLLADGGFSSSAAVFFDGPNSETVRSAAALPTITIEKPAATVMTLSTGLEINGDLLLNEGTVAASGTTMVTGSAMFMGGSIAGSGTIDVDGDITFAGALAFVPPNLRCRGNFTTDFEFQPVSGRVELNSNTTQQIFGADSRFHDLDINTVTTVLSSEDLHFSGDVVVNGLLTTTGEVDCDGDFTMNNGWNAGAGDHRFGRDLNLSGNLTNATGVFILDGNATTGTVTSTQGLPAVRIARSHTVHLGNLLVDGNVDLESGLLSVNGTVVVGGSFLVTSGELAGAGVLQIVDDFQSTGGFATAPPRIELGGNWIADSGFAPVSGLVKFVGSSPQSLSSASGSLQFQALEVANNAEITTSVPVAIRSTLTVNGKLATSSTLDVDSTVTTNTASELDLGAGTHRFSGSLDLGGQVAATGVFEFDNVTTTAINVTSAVPIPTVRKTGAGTMTLAGGLVVQGNVDSERGKLRYGNPVTVAGNATFRGGDLDSGSVLDVQGNVAFLGATATSPGTIRCAGNWSSESNFTPPNGLVELTGNGTIASLTPNQSASFHLLDVLDGVRTVVGDIAVRGTSMLVQSPATLNVGPSASLSVERAAVTINGELQLTGTGQLLLGDPASVTIEQIGKLRMLGASAAAPVRVDGLAGGNGNYSFRVRGFVAARDFEFFRPDENGLMIESTATVDATATEGFRNGTFDFPRNTPNAVLLHIDPPTSPPVALSLQNVAFQNTESAQNVFNARVTQGTPVTFLNATGSFAGATYEDDPLGDRIEWTSGQLSVIGSFQVIAGAGEATVSWATIDESTITSFTLDRQQLSPAPTPFGNAIVFATTGVPRSYQQVVAGLVAGVTYRFRLRERETPTSSLTTIATADVTPFGGGAPAEVFDVGPASPFTTIQSGIDAAINSGLASPIVRVASGTYPAFTVAGAPLQGIRIVGDGAGPVFIDTATSLTPVTIQNVPFGRSVELGDMLIGSPASPVTGVLVTGSIGTVVLDEVSIEAGAANALVVEGSLAFVLQGPGTSVQSQGGEGLVLDVSSNATVSNSNFSSVRLQGSSSLTYASINVTPAVEPGSSTTAFAGVMPHLAGERFPVLSQPLQFQFEGFPSSLWLLVISDGYSVPLPVFEMPVLVDLATLVVTFTGVTDPVGVATNSSYLPPNGALIGLTKVFQAASVSQTTGALRLSNAHAITIVSGN